RFRGTGRRGCDRPAGPRRGRRAGGEARVPASRPPLTIGAGDRSHRRFGHRGGSTEARSSMKSLPKAEVLLLLDVQQGFDAPTWGRRNNPEMEERIIELLDAWRTSSRPVIHVKHMSTGLGSPLRPEEPGNEFKVEMAPRPWER